MATISRVELRKDPGPEEDIPLTLSFSKIYFVRTKNTSIFLFPE